MPAEAGEYIVGAYLQHIKCCDVVQYNVRPPGGGLPGLSELDVIGLNLRDKQAYLCEVTTHISGLLYGTYDKTIQKVMDKHKAQKTYAAERLDGFVPKFMFWSPVVPKGPLTEQLRQIEGLHVVINEDFTAAVEKLREIASKTTHATGNPFIRTLQILEHLRRPAKQPK